MAPLEGLHLNFDNYLHVSVANRDINDFFGLLLDAAAPVKRQFPNAAPPEGVCAALIPPAFTLLRELTSRGSCSLLGRMNIALEVPRLGKSRI